MIKNRVENFLSTQELAEVWREFNENPKWRFREFAGGRWFWWYNCFPGNKSFNGIDENWMPGTANIFYTMYNRVKEFAEAQSGKQFRVYRYIINGQTVGQDGAMHSDFPGSYEDSDTFILYLNEKWDDSWGGPTKFYHNQPPHEQRHEEFPGPGKLIQYDGRILHQGCAPTQPNQLRVTLAVQGRYE